MTIGKLLLTGDLHLTDRLEDSHRWEVFERIREVCKQEEVYSCVILGDLTDRKDCHPANLVHRIIDELSTEFPPTSILKGNHDYIDEGAPFFKFLGSFGWAHRRSVGCFSTMMLVNPVQYESMLFLPHTRSPEKVWKNYIGKKPASLLLTHITLHGCQAANGMFLEGIPASLIPDADIVFSGDIHLPQTMRYRDTDFVYVGSPYHTRFVYQNYEPRFVIVEVDTDTFSYAGNWYSVPTGLKRKVAVSVSSPDEIDSQLLNSLKDTDELRIVCRQPEGTTSKEWEPLLAQFKERAPQADVQPLVEGTLTNVNRDVKTHKDLLHAYCDDRGISDTARNLGDDLLRSASSGGEDQSFQRD